MSRTKVILFASIKLKPTSLRVSCSRPIMVIYPDGVWYRQANPEVTLRIIREH
ncbi:hypothetical protein [Nostoc sp.]|uniref:hypothetical protein n=1 Tax=Nostoc sp. TaxID=1180 RepID=UPI002FF91A18